MNMKRLERDLYWGNRLFLLRALHGAEGFRGMAKDKGFSAYLKAENIPRRRAYRLIRRYLEVQRLCYRARAANEELEKEVSPPITVSELIAELKAMRDEASVTNAAEDGGRR